MAGNSEILKGYPIEEFLTDQDGRAWNKDTKACYSRLLYETKQYFDENGPLNSHTLKQWQADLLAREYKQRSINTRISALNNFPENKVSPRSLRNLCQIAQEDLYANLEQMLKSAYDQLLETENTVAGWKAGA